MDDLQRILHARALIRRYGVPIVPPPPTDQQRAEFLCCYVFRIVLT